MASMSRRERVLAALRGDSVDRPPFGFWAHNFARENSPDDLAAESLRVLNEFAFDFLKPQTRAQAFEEAFGAVWAASGERTVPPRLVRHAVKSAADLGQIQVADWNAGPLGEQLQALRLIRAAAPDVPIIWTIFNPLMIARRLLPGDIAELRTAMQEQPGPLRSALDAVTATMTGYARAAIENGADGLFYATNVASDGLLTEDEYRAWGVSDDLTILAAVADAPFTMLHTCGPAVYFDLFAEYPVQVRNYALSPQNPTLRFLELETGRAVAGGVTTKPDDLRLTETDIAFEVRAAIMETGGRHLLIAPGCSNSPQVADQVAMAARNAILGAD